MKRGIFVIMSAVVAALFCVSSADAKEKVFEKRSFNPGKFEYIECNVPCDLIYTKGKCGVEISARVEAFEKIECTVKDGKLIIKSKIRRFSDVDDIKIYVSSPELTGVDLNGAVEMKAEEGIGGKSFTANVNGAGELEIKGFKYENVVISLNGASEADIEGMDCGDVKLTCNGTADCELKGRADSADLTINGVGKIDVKELNADKLLTAVNGVGKISR